ncbi:hypothetical protein M5K25_023871 [Dendrobium thyrsiflorum]|uniref:Uncharacterized protein n=1 Tax=Dendrobium thyrsiflorum TaxID=117978 RepID=A0ABD0U0W2_DENTH
MADPERDFGMVYNEQGYIQILQSPFFDVDPEVDHTIEGYVARILDTIVLAVEEQLGTVQWRIALDPQYRTDGKSRIRQSSSAARLWEFLGGILLNMTLKAPYYWVSFLDTPKEQEKKGKLSKNKQGKSTAEKAKLMANTKMPKKAHVKVDKKAISDKYLDDDSDEDEDEDDNDPEEDSDENEDIVDSSGNSSEEERDDSSSSESTPEMIVYDKKRKSDSSSKSPIREKKAKVVTPVENNKIGGYGKKAQVHVATPRPAKQGGKPQQSSKSSGPVTFKSRNRTFNSENTFQAHRKSKYVGAGK